MAARVNLEGPGFWEELGSECHKMAHSNFTKVGIVTGIFLLCLATPVGAAGVAAVGVASYASCQPPAGSFDKTCTVSKAREYVSSDLRLNGIAFCEYDMFCQTLEGSWRKTTVIVPRKGYTLTDMENCDGVLVFREGRTDGLCKDEVEARFMSSLYGV